MSLCPDADSETLKAAKVWKLAEDMVAEKQQCQDAQSQHKEQLVLLEKKSTTYTQVSGWPPSPSWGQSFWFAWLVLALLMASSSSSWASGASPLPHLAAETPSGAPAAGPVQAGPHQCPVPGSQVQCHDP